MTLLALFHDTRDRYCCAHGHYPARMRASRGMKEALWLELEQMGLMARETGSPWIGFSFCFQCEGIHIDCDLPTHIPTFLA